MLAADGNVDASSILANSLWYKYRSASDWAWKVWDNTVASLRQLPALIPNLDDRRTCAMRYATFLLLVDHHTPTGFDDQVLNWFLGAGKTELAGLSAEVWDVLKVVLIALSMHGALTTTGILNGVVYPSWQAAARVASVEEGLRLTVTLEAVSGLFTSLMLCQEANIDGTPPMDLVQLRRIQARRQEVHRDPHFEYLVSNVPVLVFMEQNHHLPEHIRTISSLLRIQLSRASDFRQGVYRNLDAVQYAFAQTLDSDGIAVRLHKPLVNALRLVFNDTDAGHPDLSLTPREEAQHTADTAHVEGSELQDIESLLTPWKIAATGIALQFTLRQWGEELGDQTSEGAATAKLNRFMSRFFHVRMTSDQADFITKLAKGTSPAVIGRVCSRAQTL
jgi:mediator of RNA polymerase II transcription subunit 12, fungi type